MKNRTGKTIADSGAMEWLRYKCKQFREFCDNRKPTEDFFVWAVKEFLMSFEKLRLAAAALTYHSLFAFVPIMAVFVAVASLMGLDEIFRTQVVLFMQGQEAVANSLLDFADRYLLNARMNYWLGAGVGFLVLMYSLFSICQTIDDEVNFLWNLKGHGLKKQILVFLFVLLLPFVSMVLIALWFFVSSWFGGGAVFEVNRFVMTVAVCTALFFPVYKFVPNTKVKVKYALVAAVICATLFALLHLLVTWIYSFFNSYRNIYGDLATLLLFILWIYFSWMICLAGSRFNHLLQEAEDNCFKVCSMRFRKFLYFLMIAEVESMVEKNYGEAVPARRLLESVVEKYCLPACVAMEIKDELVAKSVLDDNGDEIAVSAAYKDCMVNDILDESGFREVETGSYRPDVDKLLGNLDAKGLERINQLMLKLDNAGDDLPARNIMARGLGWHSSLEYRNGQRETLPEFTEQEKVAEE